MTPLKNTSLAITAALAGLLAGTVARVEGVPFQKQTQNGAKSTKTTPVAEKHSCAGKNSCKGLGGCATDGSKNNKALVANITTDKHSCVAKNSCKGLGGCATDGSKKM